MENQLNINSERPDIIVLDITLMYHEFNNNAVFKHIDLYRGSFTDPYHVFYNIAINSIVSFLSDDYVSFVKNMLSITPNSTGIEQFYLANPIVFSDFKDSALLLGMHLFQTIREHNIFISYAVCTLISIGEGTLVIKVTPTYIL